MATEEQMNAPSSDGPRRARVLKLTGLINADMNGAELLVTFNRPLSTLERAGLVQVITDSIA